LASRVGLDAGHVVDKVEITEFNIFGVEAEGVGAVFFSLEADWHFTLGFGVDHSVVFAFNRHVDLGVVGIHLELAEAFTFAKAQQGAIDESTLIAYIHAHAGRLGSV